MTPFQIPSHVCGEDIHIFSPLATFDSPNFLIRMAWTRMKPSVLLWC
jgi:hypothetical protein